LDRALDREEIAWSARLFALESLRSGVTTLFDHHASQRNVSGSLETISRALLDFGLRACLCYEVSDREGEEITEQGIEENREFLDSIASRGGGLRRGLFGLHAAFTLSDQTLERSSAIARDLEAGFHIHVAEDRIDTEGAIARLEKAGILGPRTLCVHGVHLEDAEIEQLAASGSWLVHCPESNMNNGVGAVHLERHRTAGVRLALGTDGFTAQMPREALVAHLLQNHVSGNPGEGYRAVPELLLSGNADLASEAFDLDLGVLRTGAAADLVVWDYRAPTPLTTENFWGHLLFGLVTSRAAEVWIAGRQVLLGGSVPGLNETNLLAQCREAAERLWERI
jgi:cytosine/adenosine deaminase-related metal-dependent hydrolase